MKPAIAPTNLLKLTLSIVLALGGLTACRSDTSPTAAPPSPAASVMPKIDGKMDHSKMDHSKMPPNTMNTSAMGHNMDLGPADSDFDLRFIDAMLPHHEGAIVMAKVAQQKSTRAEIKQLATDIMAAQTTETTQMQQWRQAWYPQASAMPMAYDAKLGKMVPMATEQRQSMMMNRDLGAAGQQFDLQFINAMIPHHEGAVTMAKMALQNSQRPEIQKLAQAIVATQQAEIDQMNQWRKAWYGQ